MTISALPTVDEQVERLITLGVPEVVGVSAEDLREIGVGFGEVAGLLVLPEADPLQLTPLMRRDDKAGFVVEDLQDLGEFAPFDVEVPASAYVVTGLERGDEYSNETPNETYPKLRARGRTPITAQEGIFWLLQRPEALERNKCFMTTGSRLRKPNGTLDSRTPALWISNGTGRDGKERRGAPKVGWCWAGNRHTWLGIASAAGRLSAI